MYLQLSAIGVGPISATAYVILHIIEIRIDLRV
jgi:hypothetical protein